MSKTPTVYNGPLAAMAIRDALDAAAECHRAEQPRDMCHALGRAMANLDRMAEQLEAAMREVTRLRTEREAMRAERDERPQVLSAARIVLEDNPAEPSCGVMQDYTTVEEGGIELDAEPLWRRVMEGLDPDDEEFVGQRCRLVGESTQVGTFEITVERG